MPPHRQHWSESTDKLIFEKTQQRKVTQLPPHWQFWSESTIKETFEKRTTEKSHTNASSQAALVRIN